jgi:hypothetical protein
MDQTIDLRKKNVPLEVPKPVQRPAEPATPATVATVTEVPAEIDALEINWRTHLFPPHRLDRVLYVAGALGIVAFLVAYLAHDFLFTIVLVLAAVVLILNTTRPHRQSQISVHATGISVDDQHHRYGDIKSFWIDYQPEYGVKEISIEFKKGYVPHTRIPLEDTNPLEIRRAMLAYVPEKEHEQSLLDHLIRRSGI